MLKKVTGAAKDKLKHRLNHPPQRPLRPSRAPNWRHQHSNSGSKQGSSTSVSLRAVDNELFEQILDDDSDFTGDFTPPLARASTLSHHHDTISTASTDSLDSDLFESDMYANVDEEKEVADAAAGEEGGRNGDNNGGHSPPVAVNCDPLSGQILTSGSQEDNDGGGGGESDGIGIKDGGWNEMGSGNEAEESDDEVAVKGKEDKQSWSTGSTGGVLVADAKSLTAGDGCEEAGKKTSLDGLSEPSIGDQLKHSEVGKDEPLWRLEPSKDLQGEKETEQALEEQCLEERGSKDFEPQVASGPLSGGGLDIPNVVTLIDESPLSSLPSSLETGTLQLTSSGDDEGDSNNNNRPSPGNYLEADDDDNGDGNLTTPTHTTTVASSSAAAAAMDFGWTGEPTATTRDLFHSHTGSSSTARRTVDDELEELLASPDHEKKKLGSGWQQTDMHDHHHHHHHGALSSDEERGGSHLDSGVFEHELDTSTHELEAGGSGGGSRGKTSSLTDASTAVSKRKEDEEGMTNDSLEMSEDHFSSNIRQTSLKTTSALPVTVTANSSSSSTKTDTASSKKKVPPARPRLPPSRPPISPQLQRRMNSLKSNTSITDPVSAKPVSAKPVRPPWIGERALKKEAEMAVVEAENDSDNELFPDDARKLAEVEKLASERKSSNSPPPPIAMATNTLTTTTTTTAKEPSNNVDIAMETSPQREEEVKEEEDADKHSHTLYLTWPYHFALSLFLYLYYSLNVFTYLAGFFAGFYMLYLFLGSVFIYYVHTIEKEREEKKKQAKRKAVELSDDFVKTMKVDFSKLKEYKVCHVLTSGNS